MDFLLLKVIIVKVFGSVLVVPTHPVSLSPDDYFGVRCKVRRDDLGHTMTLLVYTITCTDRRFRTFPGSRD